MTNVEEIKEYIKIATFKKGDIFRNIERYKCHVIDNIRDHRKDGYVDLIVYRYFGRNRKRWFYAVKERWEIGMELQIMVKK